MFSLKIPFGVELSVSIAVDLTFGKGTEFAFGQWENQYLKGLFIDISLFFIGVSAEITETVTSKNDDEN